MIAQRRGLIVNISFCGGGGLLNGFALLCFVMNTALAAIGAPISERLRLWFAR
jgi:hypothetical protein